MTIHFNLTTTENVPQIIEDLVYDTVILNAFVCFASQCNIMLKLELHRTLYLCVPSAVHTEFSILCQYTNIKLRFEFSFVVDSGHDN